MMNLVLKSLNTLHKDEAGQGLVEYLLILALVAFAASVFVLTTVILEFYRGTRARVTLEPRELPGGVPIWWAVAVARR